MKLSFLGAARQVGKSCIHAQFNQVRLLMDSGLKIHDGNEPPALRQHKFDAAIITHAHLDHSGSTPTLLHYGDAPVFTVFPTIPLTNLLLEDSEKVALRNKKTLPFSKQDVKRLQKKFFGLPYEHEYEFYDGTRFTLKDAGHIPGSAQVFATDGKKNLWYTGDFNYAQTRLHSPAVTPQEIEVDALVIESTYANRDHPPREQLEKIFCETVQNALNEGKTVLVPSFAVGRMQEIAMVLNENKNRVKGEVYFDGMGTSVNEIILDFPSYVRNPGALNAAIQRGRVVESKRERKQVTQKPCVIISSAGMIDGGPALSYLQALNNKGNGVVLLTGFQVPDTNGWRLVNGLPLRVNNGSRVEKIVLPFKHFDFSAHTGRTQLFEFVKRVNPKKVFCVHGDAEVCVQFARELEEDYGFDAVAPEEGQVYNI